MKRTKIIFVTGRAQAGKDTACDYCIEQIAQDINIKTTRKFSFAEPLKEFCTNVMGLDKRQVWGNNCEKNTITHIRWDDLPLYDIDVITLKESLKVDPDAIHMTAREVMQIFGTNICRKMYPDCWARATWNAIGSCGADYAFIADARFPNELDFFHKFPHEGIHDDILVIRLNRNPINSQHQSEVALDNYNWGGLNRFHIIDNDNLSVGEKNSIVWKIVGEFING